MSQATNHAPEQHSSAAPNHLDLVVAQRSQDARENIKIVATQWTTVPSESSRCWQEPEALELAMKIQLIVETFGSPTRKQSDATTALFLVRQETLHYAIKSLDPAFAKSFFDWEERVRHEILQFLDFYQINLLGLDLSLASILEAELEYNIHNPAFGLGSRSLWLLQGCIHYPLP
jgi:hypothetical protein